MKPMGYFLLCPFVPFVVQKKPTSGQAKQNNPEPKATDYHTKKTARHPPTEPGHQDKSPVKPENVFQQTDTALKTEKN
jgi:hypothetical protein